MVSCNVGCKMQASYIDVSKAAADCRMAHEATRRPSPTVSDSWDCRIRAIKGVFKRFPAGIENPCIAILPVVI